jgi:hypothetical protein
MRRLGESGVDYIRLFPFWGGMLLPYRKGMSGKFNLDLWNNVYFDELERVVRTAYRYRMGIYFDFFDHCGTKGDNRYWNPWYSNQNGVNGIYDTSFKAEQYRIEWIKRAIETIGWRGEWKTKFGIKKKIKRNIFSLGNELTCIDSHVKVHEFGRFWAFPMAKALRELGYKRPIAFSASTHAGHAIRAYVSDEWDQGKNAGFNKLSTISQKHGWGQFDRVLLDSIYGGRRFGLSDDGLNIKDPIKKGICVQGDKYCSLRTPFVKASFYTVDYYLKSHKPKWHHLEQLPRSVSEPEHHLNDLDQDRDVNIYWRVAKRVWNVNSKRKYPDWMKDLYE